MRRNDKEIKDTAVIEEILSKAEVCRLGLCDEGKPYIVPVCFGYGDNVLYFHCASEGRKIDIIKKNSNVCFEVDIDCKIVVAEQACDWGMNYKSIVGFGKAEFVEDVEKKRTALDIIMEHYSEGDFEYTDQAIDKITVIKIEIEEMTGKNSI